MVVLNHWFNWGMTMKFNELKGNDQKEKRITFEECVVNLKIFVEEKYRNSNGSLEQIKSFMTHNEVILNYIEELAKLEAIKERDYQKVIFAAILHDVAKFDVPLIMHGFEGAKIARERLNQLRLGSEIIGEVSNAIVRHMGPIPGFMENEAKKWEQKTGEKIELPRPQTIVDKLLYDADMLSLIDRAGIKKILTLRATSLVFQNEDIKTAQEKGITQKQAAWLSALQSAEEATSSLYTDVARKKASILLEEARKSMSID